MIYSSVGVLKTNQNSGMCESPYHTYLDPYHITSLLPSCQKGQSDIRCPPPNRMIWLTCSSLLVARRTSVMGPAPPSPFHVIHKRNTAHPVRHPCKVILKNGLTSIFGSIIDSCAFGPKMPSSVLGFFILQWAITLLHTRIIFCFLAALPYS